MAASRHAAVTASVAGKACDKDQAVTGDTDDIDDDLAIEEEEEVGLTDALEAVDLADN